MIYKRQYLRRLANELSIRYEELQRVLHETDRGIIPMTDDVEMDGLDIRLAVDDFKTILSEVRRLK